MNKDRIIADLEKKKRILLAKIVRQAKEISDLKKEKK